jgi:hypothetical protein
MAPTTKVNGKKFWWTPALALTFAATMLGGANWVMDAKMKSYRAVDDERHKFLEENMSEIKMDVKEIRQHLMGK